MLGRNDFPMMDDVVSVSFRISMTEAAIGKKWQGIIQLMPPLGLDNRNGQEVYLSLISGARWHGPQNVRLQLLANDITPADPSDNPRHDIIYTLQVLIDVDPSADAFSESKLIVWGVLGAPETPVSISEWATVDGTVVDTDPAPFTVKNSDSTVIIESNWYEIA